MSGVRLGLDARLSGVRHAGLGRYIKNLAARLPGALPAGWQLTIVVADEKQWREIIDLSHEISQDVQNLSNVSVVVSPIPHYSLAEQVRLPALYRREKIDLLHVPHFNAPFFPGVAKLVVTIHDLLWHQSRGAGVTTLPAWQYGVKYAAYRALVDRVSARAAAIMVPSEQAGATVRQFYPGVAPKIQVIYNGSTDWSRFPAKAPNRPWPAKFLLYVGSLYPHKNVGLILEALGQRPDLQLVIVSARDAFCQQMRERVRARRLEKRVHFYHQLADSELKDAYQRALALVQPSFSEGFGLTGIEALSLGTPVLASDIAIFREVYGAHFYAFDPRSVASFIHELDQLTQENQGVRVAAYQAWAGRYDWDRTVDQTVAVYRKVMHE
ncbi:glycosyltransferase family 4 protein [bacterium]|nr:glycosyltransferase family 4 protein [bacterium]